MDMKSVSELIGHELDYWVGKAQKMNVKLQFDGTWIYPEVSTASGPTSHSPTSHRHRYIRAYEPTSCWVHTGELIQQYKISVRPVDQDSWFAEIDHGSKYGVGIASDPMIAICRCVVNSIYGEFVENITQPAGKHNEYGI